jgi:UPF0716 protein FxsA
MRVLKIIALGLLLLPLAEVAAFLLVASVIGFAASVLLLILISLVGLAVLRRSGTDITVRRGGADTAGAASRLAGRDSGAMIAGILLLLPGFMTGLAGAVMLHPKSRQWLLRSAISGVAAQRRSPSRSPGSEVIDLSPEEWQSLPEPKTRPRRRPPQPS